MTAPRPPRLPERLRWTVARLDLAPADAVLEIGCGPGHAIALVAERLATGTVTAIDRSPTMVARARATAAPLLASGRAAVEQRALADLAPPARFDVAFAVNVNAFWTAPAPSFAAVRRVLRDDGRLALAWEPPSARALGELRDRVAHLAAAHGFAVHAVHEAAFARGAAFCVVARPAPRPLSR